MRRVNGWLALFWVAMIPISYRSVAEQRHLCVPLSLWALVAGHCRPGSPHGVVAQAREIQRQKTEPVEQKVVEEIVEKDRRRRS